VLGRKYIFSSLTPYIKMCTEISSPATHTKTNTHTHTHKSIPFQARHARSSVLVHCKMGVSRSASTVIAYAMKQHGWNLAEAHAFVKVWPL
jgi:protein-tyrosine phosphatase